MKQNINFIEPCIVVIIFIIIAAVGFGFAINGFDSIPEKNTDCIDEIMAIAPEGNNIIEVPAGWKYLDNMDGFILVTRQACI